ncbi:hypothetical protein D1872_326780 [compost metagenome]
MSSSVLLFLVLGDYSDSAVITAPTLTNAGFAVNGVTFKALVESLEKGTFEFLGLMTVI